MGSLPNSVLITPIVTIPTPATPTVAKPQPKSVSPELKNKNAYKPQKPKQPLPEQNQSLVPTLFKSCEGAWGTISGTVSGATNAMSEYLGFETLAKSASSVYDSVAKEVEGLYKSVSATASVVYESAVKAFTASSVVDSSTPQVHSSISTSSHSSLVIDGAPSTSSSSLVGLPSTVIEISPASPLVLSSIVPFDGVQLVFGEVEKELDGPLSSVVVYQEALVVAQPSIVAQKKVEKAEAVLATVERALGEPRAQKELTSDKNKISSSVVPSESPLLSEISVKSQVIRGQGVEKLHEAPQAAEVVLVKTFFEALGGLSEEIHVQDQKHPISQNQDLPIGFGLLKKKEKETQEEGIYTAPVSPSVLPKFSALVDQKSAVSVLNHEKGLTDRALTGVSDEQAFDHSGDEGGSKGQNSSQDPSQKDQEDAEILG